MIRVFSLAYLSALSLLLMVPYFVRDELLFHSDVISAMLILAALAFALSVPLGVLFCLAWFLGGRSERALKSIAAIPIGLILAGFAIAIFERYLFAFSGLISVSAAIILLTAIAGLIIALFFWSSEFLDRVQTLGIFATGIGLSVLILGLSYTHLSAALAKEDEPKHLIFVVIDGFPSQLTQTYNPSASPTVFDEVARRSKTFLNARSSKVYTNGYFGLIYSGRTELLPGGYRRGEPHPPDLMQALQNSGIRTRIVNFHANGLPQSNGMTGHRGLRSILLTENYAWLPEILGLEYDIFLSWPKTRIGFNGRINELFQLMNPEFSESRAWNWAVLQQVSNLQSQGRSSFLIVHMSHNLHLVQRIEKDQSVAPKLRDLYNQAKRTDYTYPTSAESLMGNVRAGYKGRVDIWGRYLQRLVAGIEQSKSAESTLLMATADHGSALSKGRIWYGFHPDEEVTRVPLILFGRGQSGVRPENTDSRDVAETIGSFFGIQNEFEAGGRNLISGALPARAIPVLTIESKLRKEWFLLIYQGDQVHVFNISRKGDGQIRSGRVDGFEVGLDIADPAPSDPIWAEFNNAVVGFGLKPEQIHPKLRAVGIPSS